MAANTVSGKQILFKIAEDNNLDRGAYITNVTNPTNPVRFECSALTATDDHHYRGALIQILGKGILTIDDYVGASRQFVVNANFDAAPAQNDVVQLAYWKADQRLKAQRAMNDALAASYRRGQPCWYREVKEDGSTAGITLVAGTYEYALPSGVTFLSRVGVQETNSPVSWFPRGQLWRTGGQEGALKLQFYRGPRRDFVADWAGYKLCLWYEQREPVLTGESGTTQLPLDYFAVASEIFKRRLLAGDSGDALQTDSMVLPQLQQEAANALARCGALKDPLPAGPVLPLE